MKSLRRQSKRPIKARLSTLTCACLLEGLESRTLMSTYYVATSGNDSTGTGAQGAPFASIQHIVGSLQPGDTVNVEPGTYTGFIVGWDSGGTYGTISGTAGHPITIQKDPNAVGTVTINNRDNKTHAGIDLEPGDNYVSIIGFTVDDALGNITGTPSNPAQGEGIKVTGNNDSVISCTVTNINYGFGIIADNANGVLIQNNNINHTHDQHNGNYGHGLYLSGSLNNAQVIGNLIYDNDYIGIHVNGDVSEGGLGLVTSALIEGNIIHDNGQNGINTDGMQNSVVQNNLIYGYQYYGITMYQSNSSSSSKNNLIVNNTIVDTAGATGSALRILDGSTGNTIFNNILIGGQQGTLRISTDSIPGTHSNHNIVEDLYTDEASGNTESLAGWQQQSGQDLNSTLVPSNLAALFVNASAANFQLVSGGPAVDTGVPTFNSLSAPTVDLLGNPRPSGNNFDIGAYELQQTPPAPTLTLSGASSTNAAATYTLTLRSSDSADDAMNNWQINWGDGDIQTVAAATESLVAGNWVTTTTATHTFAGSGSYTISATAADTTGSHTAGNTVGVQVAAAASKAVFTLEPTNTTPNSALPGFRVSLEDSGGNVVTSDNSTVTLTIAGGPAGAVLGGSITATAINGVATFSNVTFNESGTYTLTARDGSVTAATSTTFHVVPVVGSVDIANMNNIIGWASDPSNPTASINIQVVIAGGPTQTFSANETRSDLSGVIGSANHGYAYATPVLSVGVHVVSVYAIEASGARVLIGTTTVTSQNSLFDEHYYLQTNPDVAAAVAGGIIATGYDHYVLYGQFEGRSPSPYWNESWYLQQNPDVAAAVRTGMVTSGFMHYYLYGQYQNRQGLLYFNSAYYLSGNPDVAAAVAAGAFPSAFEHFVLFGQYEGRSPMLYFSSTVYDASNAGILPDISGEPISSDFEHFIEYGQFEGRVASNYYNETTYLLDNADVAAAVRAGLFADGFQQWLEYGQYEGRAA